MTSLSLSSHRKIFHFFLIAIISILIFVIAVDLALSLILNSYLDNISSNFKNNLGLNLEYSNAYFDFFYGILINSLRIDKNGDKILDIKRIRLNLDILNLISKRQVICKKIYVRSAHIYKTDDLQKDYLSFLLTNMRGCKEIIKSTTIKLSNLNFMDLINLDLGGYVALVQNKLLLTRGKIRIKDAVFLQKTRADFRESLMNKPLNYVFEATYLDNDFVINKLDLASSSARFILSGRIKDFNAAISLELEGDLKNFLLEDIQFLNNDYLHTKGLLEAIFFINGPIDRPDFKTEINIANGSLNALGALKINTINSNLIWDDQGLRSKDASGLIGNAPINLNLTIDNEKTYNKVNFALSSQNLGFFNAVNVSFQGHFFDNVLKGDIGVVFGYTKEQRDLTTTFDFKNIFLDLRKLNFKSDMVGASFIKPSNSDIEKTIREIKLTKLSGNLIITENNLSVLNVKTEICNGQLEGEAILGVKENVFFYNSKINLDNLDIKDIAKEFLSSEYQLSGLLSGRIILNSESNEAIIGNIQISDGKIENNAVLVAIADFFSIPSLRTIDFNNLKILFRKIWDKYEAQIKLFSKDVWIYLDNKFFADGTMDGYLLARLTTKLMDESKRFRRLFKYIEYREPTVYFPFKLKGYVDKPRVEWLQNEFKEKLQDFLSPSKKKVLQDELNKLMEEFVQ